MPILRQSLSLASDVALLALADLQRRQITDLQRAPPELCAQYIETGSASAAAAYMSEGTVNQELEVEADLIESASQNSAAPAPTLDERTFKRLLTHATRLVRAEADRSALAAFDSERADPRELCRATLSLYGGMSELPQADRVKLVRALMLRGSN
jgi:hypothetical protein